MIRIIEWFTRNTVAANLLMWLIVVWGAATIPFLQKEVFPEMAVNIVTVTTDYLGAAPEEVEEGICRRIEEEVEGISGIKRVTSIANENVGIVSIEALQGFDLDDVLDKIKNRVNALKTLPVDAEKPIYEKVVVTREMTHIAISGHTDDLTLKKLGERVRDDVSALEGITKVSLTNVRPYEISIEVSEASLRQWGLTLDQVAAAVRRSSLDLPGGVIKSEGGEILLRAKGQAYHGHEFEELVLITKPDGTRVTLGQVATVVDHLADTSQSARFDGKSAAVVNVYRVGDQDVLEITDKVSEYVEANRHRMPEGIEMTIWRDYSEILRGRMDLMIRNASQGLLLVFVVLALFLRFRLAFWVSLGIPVSFLGAILLMPIFGVTLNMISLFAFIVVLGIVVDDAIVVGESVYKKLREGMPGFQAAVEGSREVAVPVIFAVLTTVAAFSPMFSVTGNAAEIWRQIPMIVVPCLLFSLIESKLILPAHLSHEKPFGETGILRGVARLWAPIAKAWRTIQYPFAEGLEWWSHRIYRPSLGWCLRWRYLTVSAFLTILAFTAAFFASGRTKWVFFPKVEADNVVAMLTMPLGTPVEVTIANIRRLEQAALDLREELDAESSTQQSLFRHILASIGDQPYRLEQRQNIGGILAIASGSNIGEVNIHLAPSEDRTITASEIQRRWRDKTGPIPEATELSFTFSLIAAGEDVNIQMSHPDLDELQVAANTAKEYLSQFRGVSDIADNFRSGKQEVRLSIKPSAENLGLSLTNLARQVRQGFYGEEAQRIQRNRDDVRVMVRYPQNRRNSLSDLENMRIRTPLGDEVPFSSVADARLGRGPSSIKRTDGARTINVTAEADEDVVSANQIVAKVRNELHMKLEADHPGLSITYEGDTREQEETMGSLLVGFVIAMFVIYMLMGIPFQSYLQPLIVMSAIPFGFVGALWGHFFMGFDLSIMSMLGLIALSGVVVNDSIVLVDYVNKKRRSGRSLMSAVHEAGIRRFRPIVLTSLTTCAGLTPLMLERSVQAKFMIPMAVSLSFGVLFGTFIILVLVPMLYMILEDIKRATAWLLGRSYDPDLKIGG
ncbi:MAG: efflux RND transporter permease subunit [Planctomycetota bacterium]|nr:efflux RND transporter permease subunit [Planctomycetota bacterium]